MEEAEAGCSHATAKKSKRHNYSTGESEMANNVYKALPARNPDMSVTRTVQLCAEFTKVSSRTIYRMIKNVAKKPKGGKTATQNTRLEERSIIFFFRNEIPTVKKNSLGSERRRQYDF